MIGWLIFAGIVIYFLIAALVAGILSADESDPPSNNAMFMAVFWPIVVALLICILPIIALYNLGHWIGKDRCI